MKRHTKLHPPHAPQCGADVPGSFGRIFIARRTKLRLSREDVAHETRIHARWIRLLEEGNVAGFGSITYARSFIRAYSAFLGVDPSAYLKALPEKGVLGGPRDYRYLTQSHGAWVPEEFRHAKRRPPEPASLRCIKSPVPAGLTVFALMLATTAIWAMHLAETPPTTKSATAGRPIFEEIAVNDQASSAGSVRKRAYRLLSKR